MKDNTPQEIEMILEESKGDDSHTQEHTPTETLSAWCDEFLRTRKRSTRKQPTRWGKQEQQHFIALLRTHASDFTAIAIQMTRTRNEIKRKFKAMERKNPRLAQIIFLTSADYVTLE